MTAGQFLTVLTIATAVLALWSYVRWPGAAPATFKGAILRMVIALALMQVAIGVLHAGVDAAPSLGVLVIIGAVVPVLTYAFLASIWFMKVCADQMR
jgi:hypothetical protein